MNQISLSTKIIFVIFVLTILLGLADLWQRIVKPHLESKNNAQQTVISSSPLTNNIPSVLPLPINDELPRNPFELPQKNVGQISPEGVEYNTEKKSDTEKVISESDFHYYGMWKGKNTRALINDTDLGVNEVYSGYKVLQIDDEQVVLEKNGRKITLKVEE